MCVAVAVGRGVDRGAVDAHAVRESSSSMGAIAVIRWSISRSAASKGVPRAGIDRIGNGPVQPLLGSVELFVGAVAHGHDQVGVEIPVLEPPRTRVAEVEPGCGRPRRRHPGAPFPRDGSLRWWRHRQCAAATGRQPVGTAPSCAYTRTTPGRGAGGRRSGACGGSLPEGARSDGAGRPTRSVARSDPTRSEHVEVMSQQVPGQSELRGQHRGRPVGAGELLNDRQAHGFTEGGMQRRAPLDLLVHTLGPYGSIVIESMKPT